MFNRGFDKIANIAKKVSDVARKAAQKPMSSKLKALNKVRIAADSINKSPSKLSVEEAMSLTGIKKSASGK